MTRALGVAAVYAVLAVLLALPARAETDVPLGGYWLFPIRCAAGGLTAEQRAEAIGKRAAALLELNNPAALNIRIVRLGEQANIYAGGKLFATVNPCDARANKTTVMKLAKTWAERLRTTYPLVISQKPGVGSSGIGAPASGAGPASAPIVPKPKSKPKR